MKTAVSLLFLCTGCLFLFISTIWYTAIVQFLTNIQEQTTIAPDFWNLSFVLRMVRVVFILVGIFLSGFGITMFCLRKRWTL